jgi:hypothetical protein
MTVVSDRAKRGVKRTLGFLILVVIQAFLEDFKEHIMIYWRHLR